MKVYLNIIILPVVIIGLLMTQGCSDSGKSEDPSDTAITDTTTYVAPVTDESHKANTEKSETELIDVINKADDILAAVDKIQLANKAVYIAEESDFTIWKGSKGISLHDMEDAEQFIEMLGKPISEKEEQLGPGADTFNGSFVKELAYDGIMLLLFAPKGDEKLFWVFNIVVTGKEFTTAKGIGVGSSLPEFKKQYPDIGMVMDGREDENNCAYETSMSYDCSYLTFEFKDGKINEINMLVEFP